MKTTKYLFLLLSMMVSHVAWGATITEDGGRYVYDVDTKTLTINPGSETYIRFPGGTSQIYPYKDTVEKLIINSSGNVHRIYAQGFSDLTKLKTVKIDAAISNMGKNAFYACYSLQSINFPEGLSTIEGTAFCGCRALKEVVLPKSLTTMCYDAFSNCDNLKKITFKSKSIPKTIDNVMFIYMQSDGTFVVPAGTVDSYKKAFTAQTKAVQSWEVVASTTCGVTGTDNCIYWGLDTESSTLKISGTGHVPTSFISTISAINSEAKNVSNLTVDVGITHLNSSSFMGMTNLTTVNLPSTLTNINNYTFQGCTKLEEIELPELCNNLGEGAFKNCSSLVMIKFNSKDGIEFENIKSYILEGCKTYGCLVVPAGCEDKYEDFRTCMNGSLGTEWEFGFGRTSTNYPTFYHINGDGVLTLFGEGVLEASSNTKWQGHNIKSVVIKGNIYSIGYYTFKDLSDLKSVSFLSVGLNGLVSSAFKNCNNINDIKMSRIIYIPSNSGLPNNDGYVTFIGIKPESAATGYLNETGNTSVARLGDKWKKKYVNNCGLSTVNNGEDVKFEYDYSLQSLRIYGTGAMDDYTSPRKNGTTPWDSFKSGLTSLKIEEGVTAIGSYNFYNISSLKSVDIAYTVASVGMYAFCSDSQIDNHAIPEFVKTIGNYAYSGCKNITSIRIPVNIKTIGSCAFNLCENLEQIEFLGTTIPTISNDSFSGVASTGKLIVPSGYTNSSAFLSFKNTYLPSGWTIAGHNELSGKHGNISWKFDGKLLTFTGSGEMPGYFVSETVTPTENQDLYNAKEIVIGSGITAIGYAEFKSLSLVEKVTLPSTLTKISGNAFLYCKKLNNVVIPANVTSIGQNAFGGNESLTQIEFRSTNGVTTLGNFVFRDVSETGTVKVPFGCADKYENVMAALPDGWKIDDGTVRGKAGDDIIYIYNPNTNVLTLRGTGATYDDLSRLLPSTAILGAKSIIVGSGITSIGEKALCNFSNVETVSLPEGLTSISYGAFNSNAKLKDISIPNSVTSLGSNIFYDCKSLESATLPTGLTIIPIGLFDQCVSLKSITIPAGVTSIYAVAFRNCASLTEIKFLSTTPPGMFVNVFADMPSTGTLFVPASAIAAYGNYRDKYLPGWTVSTSGAVSKLANLIQNLKSGTATKQDVDNWANQMIGK